jgi:hypothetical protein
MNWRKFVLLGWMVGCVFVASTATARMPMQGAPMPGSMGLMPMQHAPMMNAALRLRRFNDGDFHRDHRFHYFNNFNKIIFVGNFGFPWWWGPWWGWNWSYYPERRRLSSSTWNCFKTD